jgi:adenine phosphoribosyltransferase
MDTATNIVSKLVRSRKGLARADLTKLLLDPDAFASVIQKIASPFSSHGVDIIAGIEASGVPFACGVSRFLQKGFVLLRKGGRQRSWTVLREPFPKGYVRGEAGLEIVEDAVSAGQRVLIVDDFLETGVQLQTAMKLVERLGGKVIGGSFFQANRTHEHALKFTNLKVRDFYNEEDIPV